MEKKEVTTATTLSEVDSNTKFLGMSGSELVQMPFSAFPEATGDRKGLMGRADKVNIDRSTLKNFYNYPKGLLLKTDIVAVTDEMVSVEVKGNIYNHPLPQDSIFHFYQSSDNAILRSSGIANGSYIELNVLGYEGRLCLWIDPIYTSHGLNVNVYTARHGSVNSNTNCYNRIVQAINMALPTTGVSVFRLIKPEKSWNTSNLTELKSAIGGDKGLIADANLAVEAGSYYYSNTTINTPAADYFIADVVRYETNIIQRLYQININKSYTRTSADGGKTWRKYVMDAPGTVMSV